MFQPENRIATIPKTVGKLKKLNVLMINDNALEELPEELQHTSLKEVWAKNNKLLKYPTHLSAVTLLCLEGNPCMKA